MKKEMREFLTDLKDVMKKHGAYIRVEILFHDVFNGFYLGTNEQEIKIPQVYFDDISIEVLLND